MKTLYNSLSEEQPREAFNYLSYLKDKEVWNTTMELNTPEILSDIKIGIDEINSDSIVEFHSIRRNV
jgi:hypothetical protein